MEYSYIGLQMEDIGWNEDIIPIIYSNFSGLYYPELKLVKIHYSYSTNVPKTILFAENIFNVPDFSPLKPHNQYFSGTIHYGTTDKYVSDKTQALFICGDGAVVYSEITNLRCAIFDMWWLTK